MAISKRVASDTYYLRKKRQRMSRPKPAGPRQSTSFKKLLLNHAEAKHYCPFGTVDAPHHQRIYTFPLTGNITQGTGVQNREGDQISIEAIKGHLTFTAGLWTNNGAHPIAYRVLVVEHMKQVGLGTAAGWYGDNTTGLNQADLMQQGNALKVLDGNIDPKLATVHYDDMFVIQPSYWTNAIDGTTSSTDTSRNFQVVKLAIPISKKLVFQRASSVAVGKHNFYLVVIPYCGNGSSDTGDFTCNMDVIFKETL